MDSAAKIYFLWSTGRATTDFGRGYLGEFAGPAKISETAEWDAEAQAGTSVIVGQLFTFLWVLGT